MRNEDLDDYLRLLADGRRRRIIRGLRRVPDGETTVEDVVDRVHASEPASASGGPTTREDVAIDVLHKHLPRLAEHGVVEFDPEAETVRYRPDAQIEAVLDSLPEELPPARA